MLFFLFSLNKAAAQAAGPSAGPSTSTQKKRNVDSESSSGSATKYQSGNLDTNACYNIYDSMNLCNIHTNGFELKIR